MLSCKREHVEEWSSKHFSADQFVSFMLSSIFSASYHGPEGGLPSGGLQWGTQNLGHLVNQLGLDRDLVVGRGYTNTFYLLTDKHLCLGTRSSFLNRPKLQLHAAPLERVRMHWFDSDTGAGNTFRHQIIEFGDGHWRADRTGLTALGRKLKAANSEEFIEALGERAIKADVGM